jgi:IMP dehydrogenase
MAKIIDEVSRTFSEYLLIPRLTKRQHCPENVSLKTPIARYSGTTPRISLNIPFVSASMQAVSGSEMAIALADREAVLLSTALRPSNHKPQ